MRILIIGAGPIGSLLALRFAAAGEDVYLYAKGSRRAQLEGNPGHLPHVSLATNDVDADLVIFALKQHAIAAAAAQWQHLLTPDRQVWLACNGLPYWFADRWPDKAEVYRSAVDPQQAFARAFRAAPAQLLLFMGANLAADGSLAAPPDGLGLIAPGDQPIRFPCVTAITLKCADDPNVVLLEKAMANCVFGLLAMVTGCTNKAIYDNPALRALQLELCEEFAGLAGALGLSFQVDVAKMLAIGASFGPAFKASMLVDLEQGKPTERFFVADAPLVLAKSCGADMRMLAALTALAAARERRSVS